MKRCLSCFKEYQNEYTVCPNCGRVEITVPKEPVYLTPGVMLEGRYLIGEAIGVGGFGIVYKAWDCKLETVVAVKEFFVPRLATRALGEKNVIITKKSQDEFAYRKKRFLAEARNMAKFSTHRSIPNVFEFFEENNTAYIVMELLTGETLGEYLHEHDGAMDRDFVFLIVNEVGKALLSLHEAGIIHRDVAPDNIYICSGKDIRIKLLDLGAARLSDDSDDVLDIILKPGYSPVEQYDNSKNIGAWTDVYALGATMYVMLTGEKPDEATNRKIEDRVRAPHEINPAIPENLSNAIMKAMAIDVPMRYKNVSEFLKAINGDKKVLSLAKERKRRKSRRLLSAVAAVAVLCAGAFITYRMYSEKKAEEYLVPADISVWYCAEADSAENAAMRFMIDDFKESFPDVNIDLKAFAADEYEAALRGAAAQNSLPHLFESTDIPDNILDTARNVAQVKNSKQFKQCYFLDQYDKYYKGTQKRVPLAIEVPLACVITNGPTSCDFSQDFFFGTDDFGNVDIAVDSKNGRLALLNMPQTVRVGENAFFDSEGNTSPVLFTSTLGIGKVEEAIQYYEKKFVFYDAQEIMCGFTYEWSLGEGSHAEELAADKLLTWMLGNRYQSILMISKNSEGQIPLNPTCFEAKVDDENDFRKTLAPIKNIYSRFVFERD